MQRSLTDKHKTWVMYLKRCMKYFALLGILVLTISPLFYKSYSLAMQLTMDSSYVKLKEGMDSLESQLTKSYEIMNILREEEEFKRLFFLSGAPSSEYYVDIHKLQTKLRSLSLTQDLYSNVYITFRDNPVFISNYIASDSYEDVYARYFNYEGMSVEQWRKLMFEETFSDKLLPATKVFSSYYQRHAFDGVSAFINNSYYNGIDQESILAVVFDKADIVSKILYEDQLEDHFAYVVDRRNDELLLSHNYDEAAALEDPEHTKQVALSSQTYRLLTYTNEMLGIQTVIGIPSHLFSEKVNELLELALIYVIAGAILILLLSLLFSMKETLWLKRLIEVAARTTNTVFPVRNEYSYIDSAFTKISTVNEEQLKQIEALNESMKYSVLKHLLHLGVHTDREIKEVKSYFEDRFDCYCVVKILYSIEEQETLHRSIQHNMMLEVERAAKDIIDDPFMALNFHSDDMTLVIFLERHEETEIDRLKSQLSRLIRSINASSPLPVKINIGVSRIMSDVRQARAAHGEAVYAVSMNENEVSSGVYLFESANQKPNKLILDLTVLLKLHDALIAGERILVEQIYAEWLEEAAKHPLSEQEQLQIYYSFRQTVHNAREVIGSEKWNPQESFQLTVPSYGQYYDFSKLMNELRDLSLELCEVVMDHRKSNNEKLKTDIVTFIREHYSDPSLSASSIATQLMISEKYVFSFVKEQTGKTLGKYIEEIRLANAERLLVETDEANSKILMQCGFGSENTFYRAFSKKHGVSPTVWRDLHRNRTI